jgi:trigger factor
MNYKVEKQEGSKVKITFTLTVEEFNKSLDSTFVKNAKHFKVAGFRPGKVPRNMVEKVYGEDVLNYSVVEDRVDEDFRKVIEEEKLEIVSKPELNVEQVAKDKECIYTVEVYVKPEAKVLKYKGLEIDKFDKKVTDKDVEQEIKLALEKNSRNVTVDNRDLQNGDMSNINFEGFVDGVAFEGGKAENFDLTIGSGQFIPGFEDQMIGMKIGEEKDIKVTFPKDYHSENLKGKEAIFKVKLNTISVKELPKLDDEFVKDVSEFETLEDYKKDVKEKLVVKKEADYKAQKEAQVFNKLLENTEVEIPESMIEEQLENLMKQTEQQLSAQGMTLELYCQYMGQDISFVKASMKDQATRDVKFNLAIEALAKLETAEVTDEEIDNKIEDLVKQYGNDQADNFKKNPNIREYVKGQIKQDKLINILVENAIEK